MINKNNNDLDALL